jgi:hypothetical protein
LHPYLDTQQSPQRRFTMISPEALEARVVSQASQRDACEGGRWPIAVIRLGRLSLSPVAEISIDAKVI